MSSTEQNAQPATATSLEESLQDLAARMRLDASTSERARLMDVAGDLCGEAGDLDRALLYFDAAIDIYLNDGHFAAGRAVCAKLLLLKPDVVRARCTLAWLAIAGGFDDEAQDRVNDYGEAALSLTRPQIAQDQLHAMAEEVDGPDVLDAIGHALLKLGDALGADRIFGRTHSPSRTRRIYATSSDRDRAIVSRLTLALSP